MTAKNLDKAAVPVKSSKTREEIVRELYGEELVRPIDIIDVVRGRTGTSEGNFYESIRTLHDKGIVTKTSGDGRATLYTLTEEGEEIAEHLGFDEPKASESPASQSESDKEQAVKIDDDAVPDERPKIRAPGMGADRRSRDFDEEVVDDMLPDDESSGQPEGGQSLSVDTSNADSEERVEDLASQLRSLLMGSNLSPDELEAATDRVLSEARNT